MLSTNRQDYIKDLEEVVFMFSTGSDLDISHEQKTADDEYFDKFSLNGKVYEFKAQKHAETALELKRYEKRFSKLALYKILSEHYGENLPWGALTGIRPVKMARSFIGGFENEFKKVFSVRDDKIALTRDVIKTQCKILDRNAEFSDFYVGVPFCPSRCVYCSFISEEISKSKYASLYTDALVKEINGSVNLTPKVRAVYLGGGTPICLNKGDLVKILSALSPLIKDGVEFTVEAGRPDEITSEKLEILKSFGVTRVCVNPQTFKDETLKIIGRKHTGADIIEKFKLAKSYGFDINCDVIAGLPEESFSDFKSTIDKIIELSPENATVHTLSLKKGSVLKERTARLTAGELDRMLTYAYSALKGAGYEPYYLYRQKYMAGNFENVGYAKKGKACVYNVDVMEETSDNVACGANAVSKVVIKSEDRIERYGAPKDIKTYIDKVDEIIEEKKKLFGENKNA